MFRPMYSKQIFAIWTRFGFISVFRLTAFLKLEITVCFLWLSLPVHSGSLSRIYYSKLYSLIHTLTFVFSFVFAYAKNMFFHDTAHLEYVLYVVFCIACAVMCYHI